MDLFNLFASISLDTSEYDSGIDNASSAAESLQDSLYDIGSATNDASSNLSNAADAADETGGSLNDLAEDSDNSNNSFSGFSDVVDKFVSAGIAAAAVKAIQEIGSALYDLALDADQSTATIAQGTGATGEALEELTESAQTAFKKVTLASSTSLADVSSTLAEINTRFGLTGDELEDLTVTITDFATVTGQDGASAVDSLANVMSLWGLDMEDMPGLLDDITTASQGCQASASELENALATNAGAFQSLGYSTEDALAFLTMYSDNGGDVSEATRIMRTAISNLSDTTDDLPGSFQAAIEAIAKCDTTAEALQAQVGDTGLTVEDVFGSTNAQKIAQNIQSGTSTIEDWTAALENNNGVMEQTIDDSTTMSDSISSSMNRIKTDVQKLFSPAVNTIVTGAANALDGIVNFAETAPKRISSFGTSVSSTFSQVISNTTSFASDFASRASSAASGFVSNLVNGVSSLPSQFYNIGSNIVTGIWNGIQSGWSWLTDTVANLASSLLSTAKSALGIHSPSTVFRDEVGQMIGEGLALGIEDSTGDAVGAVDDMADALTDTAISIPSNLTEDYSLGASGNTSAAGYLETLVSLLSTYLPQIENMQIVLDSGSLVGGISTQMDSALGKLAIAKAR